ncbi:MAG TPA: ferrous iron transport protein B [Bacillota bacterium]|nr:ferrous iron transport protein B [Bacillota bacterium]
MHHHHGVGVSLDIPEGARKIVLAGNPNVGKSVFFNTLTGLYVDVSNYPGTTLDISHGMYGESVVIDTPGVYGISSFNDEERIARDIILGADLVINVVDAVHMERDLFLTQQIIDTGVPVIIALNMVDEAERQGLAIDFDLLQDLLGVPVVPTVAVMKKGLDDLLNRLGEARPGHIDHRLHAKLHETLSKVGKQGEALLVLEGDPVISACHGLEPGTMREEIYLNRRERVNDIINHVVRDTDKGATFSTRLGRWMIRPLTGIPLLLLVLWGMYEVIGVLIAGNLVDFTEGVLLQGYYQPWVSNLLATVIPPQSALGIILFGEFGVLTMTVTYIFGLLLPLVVGFYLILSTLEDSGYLPRIATLLDRVLTSIGLNGRAVIPIILGFGCVTMATMVTRVLGSDRERRIATFLLAMAIPCSAQLGVIIGLLAGISTPYVLLYVFGMFSLLVFVGTALNRWLPGRSSDLLIDLPPIRLPHLSNVLQKTFNKSQHFLFEAGPLFAAGALVISVLQITGALEMLQTLLAPITVDWLRMPKETATAFIMGFVRRDFGAAGLSHMVLTEIQKTVGLITLTIFVPCIASALVIFKERGNKEALIVWPAVLTIAFVVGGIVAQLFNVFNSIIAPFVFYGVLMVAGLFIGKSAYNKHQETRS